MRRAAVHTSGVDVLDTLIDGVRVGDNLVVLVDPSLTGRWLVDRYIAAAEASQLVVADATGRHSAGDPPLPDAAHLLDWQGGTHTPAAARAQLEEADEQVGTNASFAFDSLSDLAGAWGDEAALDLFLWACPRLFRRGSIALWPVALDQHDDAFVRRLTAITQVVVTARPLQDEGAGVRLEVVKADGRDGSVTGRGVVARLVDGDLRDARPVDAGRERLGGRLRDLRERRGVGQAELARAVGISPSALSQAERGVRTVSAETLVRIWEALGLPTDAHVAERGYRVHRRGNQAPAALAAGVTGQRRVADPALTMWQLAFEPRAAGRNPLFAVKATETVLVLRGLLQLTVGGSVETLHEGDTLIADTAVITAWCNPADTGAEVLWALS